ncbi:APC5 protein [Saxophila tyrrhenica]|uniref:APC5 protein n=1 Tax=Saxophila tyrrhenica TaxID=1690608 RepID=A0AAV9NUH5_9PEZI|nr:APC5 protein [Saxophila tyrrhenica]
MSLELQDGEQTTPHVRTTGDLADVPEQALEGKDLHLTARLFALLADATVGTAGHECEHGSNGQAKMMRVAAGYFERSHDAYASLNNHSGILHCLLMRETIARWDGDEATAGQMEERYLQVLADHDAAVGDGGGGAAFLQAA